MAVYRSKPTRRRTAGGSSPLTDRSFLVVLAGCLVAAFVIIAVVVAVAGAGGSSQSPSQSHPQSPSETSEVDAPADADAPAEADPTGDSRHVTLTFAGDCTLGTDEEFDYSTSFNAAYEDADDPSWFFADVAGVFADDDLTVVNMEGTLTTSDEREDKTYAFKGDAEYAQVLVDGDVEAASLANNHSFDYGEQSYDDTIEALEDAGIETFGYDRIAYFDVGEVKVALIGTYELDLGLDVEDEMLANIQEAQEAGAQIIAVYVHWGVEYEYVPNDTQIELAHAAVDAGATVVVGSHPHVLQGYEKYHGRYIIYSLGNFCFGGNSNPSDKDCLVFQQTFTVDGDDVADDDDIDVIACLLSSTSSTNNYQPTLAEGTDKERIEEKLEESNEAIAERSAELSGDDGTA